MLSDPVASRGRSGVFLGRDKDKPNYQNAAYVDVVRCSLLPTRRAHRPTQLIKLIVQVYARIGDCRDNFG